MENKREYTKEIHHNEDTEIYPVSAWSQLVELGMIGNYDGSGYWVKDGKASRDEVFSTPELDATHVIWYSK